ncbi:intracellular coagulation inhibitor 1 [Ixodes scapularis]|uniref:intracellular coagulation inhibitor 1 n=1 Tax=Ixodes scapularis TaxID=6945 RepID=UPI001C39293C|nr:intracellular coagulation inhibitor 1 [Ixodes scapularis]
MRSFATFMSLLTICWGLHEDRLTLANNRFATSLLHGLPTSTETNIFFSPYSISVALGMAFAGARGETREDLFQGFGYARSDIEDDAVLEAYASHRTRLRSLRSNSTLDEAIGAAIHERISLLSSYENVLNNSFGADLLKVDFINGGQAAVDVINGWVHGKTRGKINLLFGEPLETITQLVLLNAVYFKGTWDMVFDQRLTTKKPFMNACSTPTEVDTMRGEVYVRHKSFPLLGVDIAEIPYRGMDYSMTILLPTRIDGAEALKRNITEHLLQDLLKQLVEQQVTVYLPKFKLETEYLLKDHLKKLGINRIFGSGADISGITHDANLVVSDVVHKTVLEVHEAGTEAAGATGVIIVAESLVESVEFRVDHPFIFFIRNTQTKDILFVGQVNHL